MPFINISYAMPSLNDTTDLLTFMSYVNHGTTGMFFPFILLALWAIIFISSLASSGRFSSASRAWTFASFFCALISVMLAILNLLNKNYMYLLGLMLAFGFVWIIIQDSRE